MFDTLMYAKRLEAAGMTREQAEAQVNVIAEMVVDGVATKQDVALLKAEMAKEFAEVRAEFALVRLDLNREINRTLKIMGGMFAASTTLTIGILGLLLK